MFRTSCLSCRWNCLLLALFIGCLEFPGIVSAQQGFVHRGYLGWMVDFSRSPKIDKWPSISLDSSIIADFTETLDFLKKSGMNEVSAWGLFTDDGWDPDIGSTISPGRKKIVEQLINAAHERGIKILCGMGIYSWGFGKILAKHPELACPGNPEVFDLTKPAAWTWQKKVLDYVIDSFAFDGLSMQSGDRGWCKNGQYAGVTAMLYHAILNQKAVNYIRVKKPGYIIGISGWGMDLSNPADLDAVYELTRNVDYLVDVNETATYPGDGYRTKLISKIAPCYYGSTATPNIEPIQALDRDSYFIPTVFTSGSRLKQIFSEGGRACEAYARTRGNPGDRVTIEVIAKLLSDPSQDIVTVLRTVLNEIYVPVNDKVLNRLAEIFIRAENAFFDYAFVKDISGHDDMIILLMSRDSRVSAPEYFRQMDPSSRAKYAAVLKQLLDDAKNLEPGVRQTGSIDLLIACLGNQLNVLKQ